MTKIRKAYRFDPSLFDRIQKEKPGDLTETAWVTELLKRGLDAPTSAGEPISGELSHKWEQLYQEQNTALQKALNEALDALKAEQVLNVKLLEQNTTTTALLEAAQKQQEESKQPQGFFSRLFQR